jgi:hypothetical protein
MRSVYLQANKEIFHFDALPSKEYALALGLPSAPKIKFVQKKKVKSHGPEDGDAEAEEGWNATVAKGKGKGKAKAAAPLKVADSESGSDDEDAVEDEDEDDADEDEDEGGESADAGEEGGSDDADGEDGEEDDDGEEDEEGEKEEGAHTLKPARTATLQDAMRKRKNTDVLAPHRVAMRAEQDDDDEDDFLVKSSTQRHATLDAFEDDHVTKKPANKKKEKRAVTVVALKMVEGNGNDRQHLTFGDDGAVLYFGHLCLGLLLLEDVLHLTCLKEVLLKYDAYICCDADAAGFKPAPV